MTFDALEISQEDGARVELYALVVGAVAYRMHDDTPETIVYAGNDYIKEYIKRSRIVTGQEHLTIDLPGDHPFSTQFTTIAPGQAATLTVWSYHRELSSDVRVIYKGVVRSVAFAEDMSRSSLSVVPLSDAFGKNIPQRTFQASCNNVLFDADCKVVELSFKYEGTVSAINGNIITVTGLNAAKGNGWSTAGFISYNGVDYRLILEQSGDDCTLNLPFYSDVLNNTVAVFAGCDRTIGTCGSKFNNQDNFGGHPYVPTKDIFRSGL